MFNTSPISLFAKPFAICCSTCNSRGVSSSNNFRDSRRVATSFGIHLHQVRIRFQKLLHCLRAISRLANDVHVRLGVYHREQPYSHNKMIIGDENANLLPVFHITDSVGAMSLELTGISRATRTSTSVPFPAALSIFSSAPNRFARSDMPKSP